MTVLRPPSASLHDSGLILGLEFLDDSELFDVQDECTVPTAVCKEQPASLQRRGVCFDLTATREYTDDQSAEVESRDDDDDTINSWYDRRDFQRFRDNLDLLSKRMAHMTASRSDDSYANVLVQAHRDCCCQQSDENDDDVLLVHKVQEVLGRTRPVEFWGLHTEWTTPTIVRDRLQRRQHVWRTVQQYQHDESDLAERLRFITRPAQRFAHVLALAEYTAKQS